MEINQDLCTQCAKCIPICPVGAIHGERSTRHVVIDQEKCVECGVCYRAGICEESGLTPPILAWPRSIRAALSDPLIVHKETRIPGRGTEEMKTNDVTGRYQRGHLGLAVELGRPGVSTSFQDVEKIALTCARHGVVFEPKNPVTALMADRVCGRINPEVMNERVLSAIVEFQVPLDQAPALLADLREAANEIDTVFSLDAISLVEPDGTIPAYDALLGAGFHPSPNGKHNVGLGRPAFDFSGPGALP
jgi:ferredoxin